MGVLVFLLLQAFSAVAQGRCADRKKGPSLAAIPPAIPSNPSNRSPGGPDSYSASAQAGGCFPVGARPPGRSGSAAAARPNPEVHAGTTPPTRRSDTAAQVVPPSLLPQKRPLPDNSIVFRASAQAGGCFPVGARPPGRSGSTAAPQPIPWIVQESSPCNPPGNVPAVACGAGRANNPFRRDPLHLLTRPLHRPPKRRSLIATPRNRPTPQPDRPEGRAPTAPLPRPADASL